MEVKMIFYRAESVLRGKLEGVIANMKKQMEAMEHDFHTRIEELDEIIDYKEKTIKLLLEDKGIKE
jgi:hypothetical protein